MMTEAMIDPADRHLFFISAAGILSEVVHGPEGEESIAELRSRFGARKMQNLPEEIPLITEASSR